MVRVLHSTPSTPSVSSTYHFERSHRSRLTVAFSLGLAAAFRVPRTRGRMASASAIAAVAAPDVVVFSRPGCGFCAKAKALLSKRQVVFGVVDVGAEPERREEMIQAVTGGSSASGVTFPQILVGSKCLGGWDHLGNMKDE